MGLSSKPSGSRQTAQQSSLSGCLSTTDEAAQDEAAAWEETAWEEATCGEAAARGVAMARACRSGVSAGAASGAGAGARRERRGPLWSSAPPAECASAECTFAAGTSAATEVSGAAAALSAASAAASSPATAAAAAAAAAAAGSTAAACSIGAAVVGFSAAPAARLATASLLPLTAAVSGQPVACGQVLPRGWQAARAAQMWQAVRPAQMRRLSSPCETEHELRTSRFRPVRPRRRPLAALRAVERGREDRSRRPSLGSDLPAARARPQCGPRSP
eukprot:scaffold128693_cov68-Phaeocystis_antarctica.AAC.10